MSTYSPTLQHHHHTNHFPANPNHPYPLTPHSIGHAPAAHPVYPDTNGAGQVGEHLGGASNSPDGKTRLRKACDSCSARKVKCDDEGPPCRPCASLDIPCTFARPSRRRGPPNRHAEAIKKRRIGSPGNSGLSAPSSPTHAAQTLASFAQHQVLSAESICPFSTLQPLIDDYFIYIHPLIPIPHEPTFRAAFERREDVSNPTFLALVASMIGCLVASFPRKPRLHLKAQHKENLFPNSMSLVERCHRIAMEARGPGYLDKELTIYDAATSYLQGLIGSYTFNWRQCRLYFGECLTISRTIGLHKPIGQTYARSGSLSTIINTNGRDFDGGQEQGVDFVAQELARRLFWVVFVGVKSMQQLGVSFGELVMPPATPSEPYPPLPLEVDDAYIFPTHIVPQPPGMISELAGFNANVRVYSTYNSLCTMEMAYGIDEIFDWDRQKRVLDQCLRAAKCALDGVPRELMLRPGTGPDEMTQDNQYPPPAPEYPELGDLGQYHSDDVGETPEERRRLQYEIQKANIYASQLGTRSYIVEKYWNLYDAHNSIKSGANSAVNSPGIVAAGLDGQLPSTGTFDMTEQEMAKEREDIIKDLLIVLGMISQVNMEPNGGSFINKIRQIASTLLDVPRTRKGALALRAEQYLAAFLDVLMKLEKLGPGNGAVDGGGDANNKGGFTMEIGSEEDEEAQLRHWADLRDYQSRFAQAGGFFTETG